MDKPFAIVKFLPTEDDPLEYIDIGLAAWIVGDLDDNMTGRMYWPPKNVRNLVKFQRNFDPEWNISEVQVLRFYETYSKSWENVKNFEEDSHYETEPEGVHKKRKRIRSKRLLSESSTDDELSIRKISKADIPPPPVIVRVKNSSKPVKGQGPNAKEQKKKDREDLMEKLRAARAKAASKMAAPIQRSPWKVISDPALANPEASKPRSTVGCSQTTQDNFNLNGDASIQDQETPNGSGLYDCEGLQSNGSHLKFCPESSPAKSNLRSPARSNLSSPAKSVSSLSPTKSTAHSPTKSNGASPSHSLEYSPSQSTLKGTPRESPSDDLSKSDEERVSQFKSIPPNKSFALSPRSARAVSSSLAARSSLASGNPRDGRRRLFSFEQDSMDERLSTLDSSLGTLETLTRKNAAKLDILIMNQSRILKSLIPCEKVLSTPPNMPHLPLETKAALDTYEIFLKDSDVNLVAVCDYMGNFIRSSVVDPERASARAILAKMLTNNLAKEINLEGGNKKIAFRSLHLYQVFQGTLKTAFPESDLYAAEDALQKWLKDAKYRKQMELSSPKKTKSPKKKKSPKKSRSSKKPQPSPKKSRSHSSGRSAMHSSGRGL